MRLIKGLKSRKTLFNRENITYTSERIGVSHTEELSVATPISVNEQLISEKSDDGSLQTFLV